MFLNGTQSADVVQIGQSARRDNRNGDGLRQFDGRVDVHAAHHAVAADVGVNNAVDAVVFKTFRQINHMMLGYRRPAVYRHHAVFGIQPDDNLPGKCFTRLAHEVGIFYRRRTDNDVVQSKIQIFFNGFQVAYSAAQLYGNVFGNSSEDVLDGGEILRNAGKCTV